LEAEDNLILLYRGQFLLQIPYLVFKLLDILIRLTRHQLFRSLYRYRISAQISCQGALIEHFNEMKRVKREAGP